MKAIICGSFAYDNILVFPDRFKNHILPDKIHMLNVCFFAPQMRREFGGCAGNIAYNLKLLEGTPIPVGAVGKDFDPYALWMDQNGIARDYLHRVDDSFTAQAFITTDLDDNQITAFHPGAMNYAHVNDLRNIPKAEIGILAPDGKEAMLQHAVQFNELNIPFIFDPGQGLPMFSPDELKQFIAQADWLTVNDYEWQLLQERTGYSAEQLCQQLAAVIVTMGAKGSMIYTKDQTVSIHSVTPSQTADPTGCGDAYRAGLLYGLLNKFDWQTTGQIASLIGSIKIEHHGTQNHKFSLAEFKERYQLVFKQTF